MHEVDVDKSSTTSLKGEVNRHDNDNNGEGRNDLRNMTTRDSVYLMLRQSLWEVTFVSLDLK